MSEETSYVIALNDLDIVFPDKAPPKDIMETMVDELSDMEGISMAESGSHHITMTTKLGDDLGFWLELVGDIRGIVEKHLKNL